MTFKFPIVEKVSEKPTLNICTHVTYFKKKHCNTIVVYIYASSSVVNFSVSTIFKLCIFSEEYFTENNCGFPSAITF